MRLGWTSGPLTGAMRLMRLGWTSGLVTGTATFRMWTWASGLTLRINAGIPMAGAIRLGRPIAGAMRLGRTLEGRLELLFEWSERVLLLPLLLDRGRVIFLGRVILLYTC